MRKILFATLLTSVAFMPTTGIAEPQRGGVINVATIGEPPTLDPMATLTDLVGMISLHIFETLYTYGSDWSVVPLIAEDMPEVSSDGLVYTIQIREGITFHDGSTLDANDVSASLHRWLNNDNRGRQASEFIQSVEATASHTIEIRLEEPFAPLAPLLAFYSAIVMPEENVAVPLKEIVGSGPYMLKERRPDQYIQLTRFEDYAARDEESDGYGGKRMQYLDEIRFVPVPDPNTRVEGALAGQFEYADFVPAEALNRIREGAAEPLIIQPFQWPFLRMNTRDGLLADVRLRKAVVAALNPEDLMIVGFGSEELYTLNQALYPQGHVWHTEAGLDKHITNDPEVASRLLEEAGYDGSVPLRILTSRQFEFHYKMAEVAAQQLEAVGFNVQIDVTDWATLTERRQNPELWEIFTSQSPFQPDPSLLGMLQSANPGWWSTDTKDEVLARFNAEVDPARRLEIFGELQEVFFEEAPLVKVGDFHGLSAVSPNLKGVGAAIWPFFWNAYLEE